MRTATYQEYEMHYIHLKNGKPLSTNYETTEHVTSKILIKGPRHITKDVMKRFLTITFQSRYMQQEKNELLCYIFSSHWNKLKSKFGRPMSSVFIPHDKKQSLINDIALFLHPNAKKYYIEHGIPYKRCYLLYGPPGVGKTSLVHALATLFNRSVCMLPLSNSDIKDADLPKIMLSSPVRAMIVIEDIDAIFTNNRESKNFNSSITFSGVINLIDGLSASGDGEIYFLTTNYMSQLDSALKRDGRVDFAMEIGYPTFEVYCEMFLSYYPKETQKVAEEFASNITQKRNKKISTATLMLYFVKHRHLSAQEFLAQIRNEKFNTQGNQNGESVCSENDNDVSKSLNYYS